MAAGLHQWLGAACALLAALACGEAGAHAVLLESSPAADAVLAQAPEQITLHFTEPVPPTAVRLLRAADGASVELDAPEASNTELRTALPASLPEGAYVLSYRVISADGHPVVGSFVFAIGSLGGEADAGLAAAGIADDRWRMAGVVARALWYAALLLAAGLALFLALLRTPAALAASLRFALGWLALSGILAGIGMLAVTGGALHGGTPGVLVTGAPWRIALGSPVAASVAVAALGVGVLAAAARAAVRPARALPAGGCLPRRPELWRIEPRRDRGTTLAHPPGAGTSRPVRGLVGRGLRAAAARSAAPAGRPGAGPAAGVLEPGGPGRGLSRARRDRAGGAAAAGALRPDRDRLRPPPAAQDRAGDRPSRPCGGQPPGPDAGARAPQRCRPLAAPHDRRGSRARRRGGRADRRPRLGAAAARARRAGRSPRPCGPWEHRVRSAGRSAGPRSSARGDAREGRRKPDRPLSVDAQAVETSFALPARGIEALRFAAARVGAGHFRSRANLPLAGEWQVRNDLLVDDFTKLSIRATIVVQE